METEEGAYVDTYEARKAAAEVEADIARRELQERGFRQCWIADIRAGDIIISSPEGLNAFRTEIPLMVVERVLGQEASYYEPGEGTDPGEFVVNKVINFIGTTEANIQREFSFGHTHSIHIYREGW